jgi:cell division protease FtsH
MVTRYGMTDALGPMVYVDDESSDGFGRGFTRTMSEATQQKVDAKSAASRRAVRLARLLEENRDKVEAMTKALMEWETIDADQINDIMAGARRARRRARRRSAATRRAAARPPR